MLKAKEPIEWWMTLFYQSYGWSEEEENLVLPNTHRALVDISLITNICKCWHSLIATWFTIHDSVSLFSNKQSYYTNICNLHLIRGRRDASTHLAPASSTTARTVAPTWGRHWRVNKGEWRLLTWIAHWNHVIMLPFVRSNDITSRRSSSRIGRSRRTPNAERRTPKAKCEICKWAPQWCAVSIFMQIATDSCWIGQPTVQPLNCSQRRQRQRTCAPPKDSRRISPTNVEWNHLSQH